MKITEMTKADFAAIPYLPLWTEWEKLAPNGRLEFRSVVIVPVERDGKVELHDSGWGCMDFVLVNKDHEPIGKIGGGSDVLHIDGIGGYGPHEDQVWAWEKSLYSGFVPAKGWTIDCLPCGYLNLWTKRTLFLEDKFVGSSCEIYSESKMRKE